MKEKSDEEGEDSDEEDGTQVEDSLLDLHQHQYHQRDEAGR